MEEVKPHSDDTFNVSSTNSSPSLVKGKLTPTQNENSKSILIPIQRQESGIKSRRGPQHYRQILAESEPFHNVMPAAVIDTIVSYLISYRVLCGLESGLIESYDVTSRTPTVVTSSFHPKGNSSIETMACLDDGRLITGSHAFSNNLLAWSVATRRVLLTYRGHAKSVFSLCLLSDGRLASGSADHSIRIWNVDTGNCDRVLSGHSDYVWCMTEVGTSLVLASGGADAFIKLWSISSGKCLRSIKSHASRVTSLNPMEDGRIISSSLDRTIKIWNMEEAKCECLMTGHMGPVHCVTVLNDGRIATGSADKTIKIWRIEGSGADTTAACVMTIKSNTGTAINCLALMPDGCVGAGTYDGSVEFWRIWDNYAECERTIKCSACVNCILPRVE